MKNVLGALFWVGIYLLLVVAPLVIVVGGPGGQPRPFLVEFSVALGFLGLSIMGLEFALVARFGTVAGPFGIDFLTRFHREVSIVALIFICAHPILLFIQDAPRFLPLLNVWTAPWRARFGVASIVLLLVLVGVSIWRKRLRISYEVWQLSHGVLAVVVVLFAVIHIDLVGYYVSGLVRTILVDVFSASLVLLLLWVRVVAPTLRLRKHWRVVEVRPELGNSSTIVLEPVGHRGFSFLPGQFAWLNTRGSPYAITYHPISFSSSGDVDPGGQVAVTIRAVGDWTRSVQSIKPGTAVYLDGPHGVFSMDLAQAPGYVFMAGGVGITPMYSMIQTMAGRGDVRPMWLFDANTDWDSVTFRDELAQLDRRLPNLHLVHVVEQPPTGWTGESGRITVDVLRRHLPEQYRRFEYFICGPGPMMDAMENALSVIGVADSHIDTERFDMV